MAILEGRRKIEEHCGNSTWRESIGAAQPLEQIDRGFNGVKRGCFNSSLLDNRDDTPMLERFHKGQLRVEDVSQVTCYWSTNLPGAAVRSGDSHELVAMGTAGPIRLDITEQSAERRQHRAVVSHEFAS
jgi:hypothetical protein